MATKRKKKRAVRAPLTSARVFMGTLDELSDAIAAKMAGKLSTARTDIPAMPTPYPSGQMASTPPPSLKAPNENTKELVKDINLKATALAQRLSELEGNLRGEPLNTGSGSAATSPPCSLNGTLDETLAMLGGAHQALTRIGVYVGIEV